MHIAGLKTASCYAPKREHFLHVQVLFIFICIPKAYLLMVSIFTSVTNTSELVWRDYLNTPEA